MRAVKLFAPIGKGNAAASYGYLLLYNPLYQTVLGHNHAERTAIGKLQPHHKPVVIRQARGFHFHDSPTGAAFDRL